MNRRNLIFSLPNSKFHVSIPIQKAFGSKKLRPSFNCSSSQSDHILEKLTPSSCVSASGSLKILKSSPKEGRVGPNAK